MNITLPLIGVEKYGGIRVLCEVANYLQTKGYSVQIVILNADRLPFNIHPGIKILPVLFLKRYPRFRFLQLLYFSISLLFLNTKADVILSNYYITCYTSFLYTLFYRKCRHLYYIQAYEANWVQNPLLKGLVTLSYRIPSDIIVVARWIGEKVSESNKKPFCVINNCINHAVFCSKNIAKKSKSIISLNGTWAPLKGFSLFLEASKEILTINNSISFNILTSQPKFQLPEEYGENYNILRPKDDLELALLYSESTVFVNPALEEGFGLPALEAMACGTPVITTDNGGCREYAVHMFNSLIIKPGSIPQMVDSLLLLLSNEELQLTLCKNGIKTASRFNWENKLAPLLTLLSATDAGKASRK